MSSPRRKTKRIVALVIAGLLACTGNAFADKPSWAGGKKAEKHEKKEKHERHDEYEYEREDHHGRGGHGPEVHVYFGDHHRTAVREYYHEQYRSGHCPPGLAKKKNGCMPPGQAKKWMRGRPLPREVIFYDVAPEVAIRLGPPPAGHRFVRVASDILMIAVGTGMVVDAIQDLGEMR